MAHRLIGSAHRLIGSAHRLIGSAHRPIVRSRNMTLADSALGAIRRYALLPRGGRVVVALSGGPDSVALLHLLLELQDRGELVVSAAAHFNHQLRGADADADEQFCSDLAASLGVRFARGAADVRGLAREQKRSIEDAARRARYAFLTAVAKDLGADGVAVGHTRDDQAETFLLRLLRGAGTRGLAAIRPKAGVVIRPLIDVRRLDLRAYAEARRLPFREDATNADLAIPRNRVRHELIPYLQREFSPGIVEVLAREATSAREDEEKLHAEAIDLAASVVLTNTAHTAPLVDADQLSSLHPALGARVAREALARLGSEQFIGFEHIHRLLDFAAHAKEGAAMSLPGQRVVRRGRWIEFGPEPDRTQGSRIDFLFPLSIPGEVVLERQGWAVSAKWGHPPAELAGTGCVVTGPKLPLVVRSRRPGDRFQPPGMAGRSKKLQDYLVDRKVARSERDLLPIVVDSDDRIVWVVGHAVSEDFRAVAPSNRVIFLQARHLGGEV
jgi:tRNA(Ile)-lysidine synthase